MRCQVLLIAVIMSCLLSSGCYFLAEQPHLERRQKDIREYLELHSPQMNEQRKKMILTGQVQEGFTKEEVRMAYGKPDKLELMSQSEFDEFWQYKGWWGDEYLYFHGEVLVQKVIVSHKK